MPSARPKTVARKNPASVVHSVTYELSAIALRYCHSAANTSVGAGRMASGTLSSRQASSQIRNIASTNTVGDTTLRASSLLSTSSPDQRAQLVHDVLEVL